MLASQAYIPKIHDDEAEIAVTDFVGDMNEASTAPPASTAARCSVHADEK